MGEEQKNLSFANIKEEFKSIKLLFTQYGIVHEAMALQFKMYPLACSERSVGGDIKIDWNSKKIQCNIFTDFYYKRVPVKKTANGQEKIVYEIVPKKTAKKTLPRNKQKEYNQTIKQIYDNLKSWLSKLTWDDQTIIIVYVDNQRVQYE